MKISKEWLEDKDWTKWGGHGANSKRNLFYFWNNLFNNCVLGMRFAFSFEVKNQTAIEPFLFVPARF